MTDLPARSLHDIARDYIERYGWRVIPVPYQTKIPRLTDWPNLQITVEQVAQFFRGWTNIGVVLGTVSNGLADVDLDCAEAVALSWMMPTTGKTFGRRGNPRSHRLYQITGPIPSLKFVDPITGETLLELRGDKHGGGPGEQTVLPPSVHESGEPIEWVEDGEIAVIAYADLKLCVTALAIECLVARYCPGATTVEEKQAALAQADPRIRKQIERWKAEAGVASATHDSGQQFLSAQGRDLSHLNRPGRRAVGDTAQVEHAPLALTEHNVAWVWTMLTYQSSRERGDWLRFGGAIHDIPDWPEDLRRRMWDKWSIEMDPAQTEAEKKFRQQNQDDTWRSFGRGYTGKRATIGTIYHHAKAAGWDGHTLKPLPEELRQFLPPPTEQSVQNTTGDPELDLEVKRLAGLALVPYNRQRKQAAKKHDISVTLLDKVVAAERSVMFGDDADDERQGHAFKPIEPEPWPQSVNGYLLVSRLVEAVLRYVATSRENAIITALWVIHTYTYDLTNCTPRFCVSAPSKGCGKTTLLRVLRRLVNRPFMAISLTSSVIFRVVEKYKPTLLLDEAEKLFRRSDNGDINASEIVAILNGGHCPEEDVARIVGDDHETRCFSTHAPAAFGLIGGLPDQLDDRSVRIQLKRKRPGERVKRFRMGRTEDLELLARQVRRWCDDNRERLATADPEIPENELFNRAADNWEPLLAIADAAGWGDQVREIAFAIVAQKKDEGQQVMLLSDIQQYIHELRTPVAIKSDLMRMHLNGLEHRPWGGFRRGQGITTHWLASQLADFGIHPEPEPIRFAVTERGNIIEERIRGYLTAKFEDAFARYLSMGVAATESHLHT